LLRGLLYWKKIKPHPRGFCCIRDIIHLGRPRISISYPGKRSTQSD
jgi:hypothetical protein